MLRGRVQFEITNLLHNLNDTESAVISFLNILGSVEKNQSWRLTLLQMVNSSCSFGVNNILYTNIKIESPILSLFNMRNLRQ